MAFNFNAAFDPGELFQGEVLFPAWYQILLDFPPSSMLDVMRTSELHSGFMLALCPLSSGSLTPEPEEVSMEELAAPKAIYIVRNAVLEPRGWNCLQLYDEYDIEASENGFSPEKLCPLMHALDVLPANYSLHLPKTIWIPHSETMVVLTLNMTVINTIRAPENTEPFSKFLRDKATSLLDQNYNAKGFDQTRLASSRGKGGVLGGFAAPVYVAKTSAQFAREEAHGQTVEEGAVGDTAKLQSFAFLAALHDFDFEAIRRLVGPSLDFKSLSLPGTLSDHLSYSRSLVGVITTGPLLLQHGLLGDWTRSLHPTDADSAINGKFQACFRHL